MWGMNCLIGTFVSLRMRSSVSALTGGYQVGPWHQDFLPVISLPELPLKVTSSQQPGSLIYLTTHTHTHTQLILDDISWWLDAEKCGCRGAIRGQESNVTGWHCSHHQDLWGQCWSSPCQLKHFFPSARVSHCLALMVIWCQGDSVQMECFSALRRKICLLSHA